MILSHLSGILGRAEVVRGQSSAMPLPITSVRLTMVDKNGICKPKFHHVTPYKILSQESGIKDVGHPGSLPTLLVSLLTQPHFSLKAVLFFCVAVLFFKSMGRSEGMEDRLWEVWIY